jgi:hypothetical protein
MNFEAEQFSTLWNSWRRESPTRGSNDEWNPADIVSGQYLDCWIGSGQEQDGEDCELAGKV